MKQCLWLLSVLPLTSCQIPLNEHRALAFELDVRVVDRAGLPASLSDLEADPISSK